MSRTKAQLLAAIADAKADFESAIYGPDVRDAMCDIADVVSEAVEDQLIEVDTTLSQSGAGADAAVVGAALNGALTHRGNTSADDDINDTKYAHGGQWYAPTTGRPNRDGHFPFDSGTARIFTLGADTDVISGKAQIVLSNTNELAWRIGSSNTWGSWCYLMRMAKLEEYVNGSLLYRGQASAEDDIDSAAFAVNGQWYIPASAHPEHYPFTTGAGRLVTFGNQADGIAGKMHLVFGYGGKVAWRFGYNTTVDAQSVQMWSQWRTLADEDDMAEVDNSFFKANRAAMADNSLASDLTSPGSYSKAAAVTVTDLPTQKSGYIYKPIKLESTYQFYHNAYAELWYRNGGGWHLASPGNSYGYSLAGKVLAGVGSSFMRQYNTSTFVPIGKQWFSLIGDKFAMTYYNNGLAGSAIARKTGETAASIAARIDTILTEHTNTDEDASNGTLYPGDSVDYFIILGGGNDSSNSIPLGDIDSQDDTTFHGALNVITDKIRTKYPRAKLLYITCFRRWLADTTHTQSGHNTLGLVDQDYANAMVESAKYNSVNVFDAWHESGLMPKYGDSSQADSIYAWPWISRDNKHLNEDGNAYIAPIIAKRLNEI